MYAMVLEVDLQMKVNVKSNFICIWVFMNVGEVAAKDL